MALQVDVVGRTTSDGDASTSVKLVGSLEADTVPIAEKATKGLLAAPTKVVVFDLAGVNFVSSVGISYLLAARKAIEAKGSGCFFSSLQPQVRKAFDIMKALPSASVFGSVKELDDYLAEMQRKVTEEE